MGIFRDICKPAVTVFCLSVGFSLSAAAQSVDLEQLMIELADPATQNWQAVERKIQREWSKSGSASMDLLLQRGEAALEADDYDAALQHFTALTDHAPDFAEGWNGRATALFNKELLGPALQDIGRALALNPQQFEAMTGLAVILQITGQRRKALQVWRLVQAVNPHRPEVAEAIEALEVEMRGEAL